MKKKIVDGHMTVTAGSGKFVATSDRKVFGKTLSLGSGTTALEIVEDLEETFKTEEYEEDTELDQ